ncbi:MAG: GntR family transcriptional regulator [Clostridiales bacterium]|nr:GntR family transcriptional regulator [Clostridiales bacterium]
MIKSLAEQVYDHVVRMIQTGELKEGDKVGEVFLVERIGISRTPIREALIQLASDNILENVPRKGFYVKGINNDALNKVYELVYLLDSYAIELAMDNIGDKEIAEMEECIEKMNLAIGLKVYEVYEQWQKRFHEVYREVTGNDEINDTIEYLLKKIISSTYLLGEEDQLFEVSAQYNKEHEDILDAIKEKNIEKAKRLLENHWIGGKYNR